MKSKTWKKAALFTLTMSWSVFTTGCISPAIFKAILGLVEAIFNDVSGTGAGNGGTRTTGTNTGVGTRNAGNTGLTSTDGNVQVTPGQGARAGQPTTPNRQAGAGLAETDVSGGNAQNAGQPQEEAIPPTELTRQRTAALRNWLSAVFRVTEMANSFLTNDTLDCQAVAADKRDVALMLGTMIGRMQVIETRVTALERATLTPTEQTARTNEIENELLVSSGGLAGEDAAKQLRGDPQGGVQAFQSQFARMKEDRTNSDEARGFIAAGSLLDQVWQVHKQARGCRGPQ